MTDRTAELRQAFLTEAGDLLVELEDSLLLLEEKPTDRDTIDRIFRAVHTLKGSAAMFGFEQISQFAHNLENAFDQVRAGSQEVSGDLIALALRAKDLFDQMLEGDAPQDQIDVHCAALAEITGKSTNEPAASDAAEDSASSEDKPDHWFIRFQPHGNFFANGSDPLPLLQELADLGQTHVTLHNEVPGLADMDPETCYCSWDIALSGPCSEDEIRDVFVFVEDDCELSIRKIEADGAEPARLGNILVARGDIAAEDLNQALADQKPLGKILEETGKISSSRLSSALAEQQTRRQVGDQKARRSANQTVRVPSDKLDQLMDLVGELVTVHARLERHANRRTDGETTNLVEEVGRITWELRENAMGIRMLPIGNIFSKFRRLVRDLSHELGKDIQLITAGDETEIDKTIIEHLNDPLVHLVRNAVDHGLETAAERKARGKDPMGTIELSARQQGPNVVVSIRDDGGGIDLEAVRAKAVNKGLLEPQEEIEEQALIQMIFAPGFSTAKEVTSTSGRGVGMDVLRRNIDTIGGSIEVQTELGQGTTIALKLPLTLAIIEGLLVRIATRFFVVPLAAVEECIELDGNSRDQVQGRHMIDLRGHVLPYLEPRRLFHIDGPVPPREQIVVVRNDKRLLGLAVDEIIGQHQTVIKSLGKVYRDIKGFSGGTVLGDGDIALILDVPALAGMAAETVKEAQLV